MKSIEEKAKCYDEAIEKFDVILNLNTVKESGTIFAADVRKIFPELKESEDEKIRKEIIEGLKLMKERGSFVFIPSHIDSAIAWLEKQGKYESTDNKEKLDVLKFLRKETGCGLAEANNALLELIKVLKEHPITIMDKSYKLKIEWEQQH